jgi:hypothetical protein
MTAADCVAFCVLVALIVGVVAWRIGFRDASAQRSAWGDDVSVT